LDKGYSEEMKDNMHSLVGKRKLGSSLEFQEIFQDWSTDFGK
jgi:hypothetical protein